MQKHNLLSIVLAVLSLSVLALCEDIDVEKLKSQIPQGIIPEGFNTSALPSVDDAKTVIKEKCLKTSGSDKAYEDAEEASNNFKDCIMDLIDIEQLQKEIEEAQPNGELDTVFNKYCRRRTTAIDCMKNFTTTIEPCLNEKEVANKKTFVNIFTNLLNFVCHKDGDQIALFIAEKGPECFNDKKDALTNCINSTLSSYIPSGPTTLDNLPELVMGTKECNDMSKLQVCIVQELETCQESTPANLVESMFKFVRNETPCVNITTVNPQRRSNSGVSITPTISTLAITLSIVVFKYIS